MKNNLEIYPVFRAQINEIKEVSAEGIRNSPKNYEQVRYHKIYSGLRNLEKWLTLNPTISQINFEEIINNEKRNDRNSQGVTLHIGYTQQSKKECFTVVDINLGGCQKNI